MRPIRLALPQPYIQFTYIPNDWQGIAVLASFVQNLYLEMLRTCRVQTVHFNDFVPICKTCKLPRSPAHFLAQPKANLWWPWSGSQLKPHFCFALPPSQPQNLFVSLCGFTFFPLYSCWKISFKAWLRSDPKRHSLQRTRSTCKLRGLWARRNSCACHSFRHHRGIYCWTRNCQRHVPAPEGSLQ